TLLNNTMLDLLEASHTSLQEISAVAVGVPGPIDFDSGKVVIAPNVPFWEDLPLRTLIEEVFPVPVALDNDVNMAALGEHWKGAARDCPTFFFLALGTGVGGGVFVNGRLHRGGRCSAGEIGYMVLQPFQRDRRQGDLGWLESVASGLSLDQNGRKLARNKNSSLLNQLAGSSERVTSRHVFEAAEKGDQDCQKILEEFFEYLGIAIFNVVALLDPDIIVIGGGIGEQGERILGPLQERASGYGLPIPPLQLSQLKAEAQLYGAIYSAILTGEGR
ncbi:MAG TPA: ROK family protein, partial [Acidobacteriota bacterium]|nr:ROK family protein [Acidobacteriota bacterium]